MHLKLNYATLYFLSSCYLVNNQQTNIVSCLSFFESILLSRLVTPKNILNVHYFLLMMTERVFSRNWGTCMHQRESGCVSRGVHTLCRYPSLCLVALAPSKERTAPAQPHSSRISISNDIVWLISNVLDICTKKYITTNSHCNGENYNMIVLDRIHFNVIFNLYNAACFFK